VKKYNFKSTLLEYYKKCLLEDEDYGSGGDPSSLDQYPNIITNPFLRDRTNPNYRGNNNTLGIPGVSQQDIDRLDQQLRGSLGIGVKQIDRSLVRALIAGMNGQPLNPSILRQIFNLPENTPLENIQNLLQNIIIITLIIQVAAMGVPLFTEAGATEIANLLRGGLLTADVFDNIDDYLLTPLENVESVWAWILNILNQAGPEHSEEVERLVNVMLQYYRQIIGQNIHYSGQELRDLINDVQTGQIPADSQLLYLTDPRWQDAPYDQNMDTQMPLYIYVYAWNAQLGAWTLVRRVSVGDPDWYDILYNQNGNTPVFNGREVKGWLPGSYQIMNPIPLEFGTPSYTAPGPREPKPVKYKGPETTDPNFVGPPSP